MRQSRRAGVYRLVSVWQIEIHNFCQLAVDNKPVDFFEEIQFMAAILNNSEMKK